MKGLFVKKVLRKPLLPVLILFLLVEACASLSKSGANCWERRAVYDIGSGSTKLKVADVNICRHSDVKVVFEDARPVDYASDYSRSDTQALSTDILSKGKDAIRSLQKEASAHSPKRSFAYMTGVFRRAKNAPDVRQDFQSTFGFKFIIFSQDDEAKIAFASVEKSLKMNPDRLLVWDIGGSSMQFVSKNGSEWVMDLLDTASVSFKEKLIREIQLKDPRRTYSPNPIGWEGSQRALALAEFEADKVNDGVRKKIKSRRTTIVGVGSVHRFSIRGQTGKKDSYQLSDLMNTLERQASKSDQEIGGDYAATDVSNLILVAGFMKRLGIQEVQVEKADLQEGVLRSTDYW